MLSRWQRLRASTQACAIEPLLRMGLLRLPPTWDVVALALLLALSSWSASLMTCDRLCCVLLGAGGAEAPLLGSSPPLAVTAAGVRSVH